LGEINMKDINDIMPKVPNMKWGALMNKPPTNEKFTEMNKIFPDNGKWHTVFEEKNAITIDGKEILKKDPNKWT
jgi:hypothetical protein